MIAIGTALPIESAGRDPETINAMAEKWIETQQKTLDS